MRSGLAKLQQQVREGKTSALVAMEFLVTVAGPLVNALIGGLGYLLWN